MQLESFCQFHNQEYKRIIKYIITRWLSLEAAVGHALRLLPSYFLSEDKSPRFERFREHFENPILEAYLSFYQFSLKVYIQLNLLLQREDPLISHVHGHIQRFLKKLTLKFLNSVRNSPRQSVNAEAFAEAYLRFSVSPSAKKMLRQLNDDVDDVFHTNFKLDFMTQIIYCIIHIFLCSLSILLLFSLNSF